MNVKTIEILKLTGASKPTIYRWMEKHPTLDVRDEGSPLGHPFPKPQKKEGREVIWDGDEVRAWWAANARTIGRHPVEGQMITLPWDRYRAATLAAPDVYEEDGVMIINDHMKSILRIEHEGDQVRLWFRDPTDAVLFKLKYA